MEPVTIIETPPLIVVGVTGFMRTGTGSFCVAGVSSEHVSEEFKRHFYRNWLVVL